MKEYKITKERLEAMAKKCSEVKEVLKEGFPEAFEEEWVDITEDMTWRVKEGTKGYVLIGYYALNEVVQCEVGLYLCLRYTAGATEDNYRIEEVDHRFRILKRQSK